MSGRHGLQFDPMPPSILPSKWLPARHTFHGEQGPILHARKLSRQQDEFISNSDVSPAHPTALLPRLLMHGAQLVVMQITEGHVQSGHHLDIEQVPDQLPLLHRQQHLLIMTYEMLSCTLKRHFRETLVKSDTLLVS